ncbi:hypothetical protein B0H11DRAFT_1902029 [Mycena galericulata]|nr:hypothetical protein B0H11DRAFT_1902029 [Mycena galericulata]
MCEVGGDIAYVMRCLKIDSGKLSVIRGGGGARRGTTGTSRTRGCRQRRGSDFRFATRKGKKMTVTLPPWSANCAIDTFAVAFRTTPVGGGVVLADRTREWTYFLKRVPAGLIFMWWKHDSALRSARTDQISGHISAFGCRNMEKARSGCGTVGGIFNTPFGEGRVPCGSFVFFTAPPVAFRNTRTALRVFLLPRSCVSLDVDCGAGQLREERTTNVRRPQPGKLCGHLGDLPRRKVCDWTCESGIEAEIRRDTPIRHGHGVTRCKGRKTGTALIMLGNESSGEMKSGMSWKQAGVVKIRSTVRPRLGSGSENLNSFRFFS